MLFRSYKHAVIRNLISTPLLRAVRDEIRSNISFTPKETDIYRIHQSGDLANLDGLDASSLKMLPSLVKLRDALYSAPFRQYISTVANSGPLSGKKTDMAVNVYTPGCHLLCHDDVIGSRRVSYILYLTDPDIPWKPEWGGALRLYPTETFKEDDGTEAKVPSADFSLVIPPAFNQLSFFAVQPGESFHDVEEVYARPADSTDTDAEDGGRVRMAISGWFHIPQEGEDGYEEGAEERQAETSSLSQLQGGRSGGKKYDLPKDQWEEAHADEAVPSEDLNMEMTEEDLTFLIKFINPHYLTPDIVATLSEQFEEESSLRLGEFLTNRFALALKDAISTADGKEARREDGWKIARPPHKHRFMYLEPSSEEEVPAADKSTSPSASKGKGKAKAKAVAPTRKHSSDLSKLLNEYLPSPSFTKWLRLATGLTLHNPYNLRVRRFRKGLDYTLATNYDADEPQLEVCVGLTPSSGWAGTGAVEDEEAEEGADDSDDDDNKKATSADKPRDRNTPKPTNGQSTDKPKSSNADANIDSTETNPAPIDVGGYEVYMAGDEAPAAPPRVSQAGSDPHGAPPNTGAGVRASTTTPVTKNKDPHHDPAVYCAAGDDEDDGILLSNPAAWNVLTVALRDEGVLKFVKYVSQAAMGDRWDLVGEWRVGDDEEEEEKGGDE